MQPAPPTRARALRAAGLAPRTTAGQRAQGQTPGRAALPYVCDTENELSSRVQGVLLLPAFHTENVHLPHVGPRGQVLGIRRKGQSPGVHCTETRKTTVRKDGPVTEKLVKHGGSETRCGPFGKSPTASRGTHTSRNARKATGALRCHAAYSTPHGPRTPRPHAPEAHRGLGTGQAAPRDLGNQ